VSLTRIVDTLHAHLSRAPISEQDKHFYLAWIEKEITEERDQWQWIAAGCLVAGFLVGFTLAAVMFYL
jgi:hypothetical protein